MPEQSVRVSGGAYLVFRHPSLKRALHVTHGTTEIKWSYNLNTISTPTYGGEVVQILSCYVGPMTITGQTANNDELDRIYDWFLDYMTLAGKGDRRDERAVIMEYPERGWTFKLQVTQLPNFQKGTTLLGTPWQIQAEVVNDDARAYLSQHTMNALNQPLFNETLAKVGFDHTSPTINPSAQANMGFETTTLGDNFQRLIGAWSSGDFAHWGFDALRDPDTQFTKSAKEYWVSLFGSEYVSGRFPGGQGSDQLGDIGNPMSEGAIVAAIATAFEAKGVPGELGVAVAKHESGLNPNSVQIGCDLPSCGIGLFQVNGDGSGRDSSLEVKRAGQHRNDGPGSITKYYPSGSQIKAAANWFDAAGNRGDELGAWAAKAQGPKDPAGFAAEIRRMIPEARRLVEKYKNAILPNTFPGSPVPGQKPHAPTHATGGLPGYPAYDYMARAGTPCVAPVSGTVTKLSGSKAGSHCSPGGACGFSIYISGGGKSYFLTHLDQVLVRVGQSVIQGQQIAVVSDGPPSWSSPHVHMGVNG